MEPLADVPMIGEVIVIAAIFALGTWLIRHRIAGFRKGGEE